MDMNLGIKSPSQIRNTLIASAVSALICGVFLVDSLIFWFPGAVFGFLYAIANFHKKLEIGLYTILSGIIHIGAVLIFFRAAGNDLNNYLIGGFLAGAFGALTLAGITRSMSQTSLGSSLDIRSTLIGGIAGIIFIQLLRFSVVKSFDDVNLVQLINPIAFAIWQIPVAWSLTISTQPSSTGLDGASKNVHN
jgi:hypothetical protein